MKVDLHGVKHCNVERVLEDNFLVRENRDGWQIITGRSSMMKDIVINFLEYNGYQWYIPMWNEGMIIIID